MYKNGNAKDCKFMFQDSQQENGTLLMTRIMDSMVKEMKMTIKFETKVIKPNLCDYPDAYILVTGNITVTGSNADTKVVFKNCAPFTRSVTHKNDEHVETAENLDIIMPMYNLLEYSDNYADSSASLWQFRRDEQNITAAGIPNAVTTDNSSSNATRVLNGVKIVVPLEYLSNFFRSLEMPLINCKIHLELCNV